MDQGGHVSHGAPVALAGRFFEIEHYRVRPETFLLDYDAIREQALRFRPKLIICGTSAYSRTIDFARFRAIADEVGAYLMADISHISGLISAGVHPSPVDHAHFTTTSTYKPGGPRGGLILMGRDFDQPFQAGNRTMPLWERIEKNTFPGFQGTPYLNNIAAKAVFFKEMLSAEYNDRQSRIVENAKALAEEFVRLGYDVLTGGTDNHMFLANVANLRTGSDRLDRPELPGGLRHHREHEPPALRQPERPHHQRHAAGHADRHQERHGNRGDADHLATGRSGPDAGRDPGRQGIPARSGFCDEIKNQVHSLATGSRCSNTPTVLIARVPQPNLCWLCSSDELLEGQTLSRDHGPTSLTVAPEANVRPRIAFHCCDSRRGSYSPTPADSSPHRRRYRSCTCARKPSK